MNKKLYLLFFLIFGTACLSFSCTSCISLNFNNKNLKYELKPIKIIKIIDGDTIETSTNELIRLHGIDTPESREFIKNKWVQTNGIQKTWALKAKLYLSKIIKNQGNLIYMDTKFKTYDKYGRTVAQIFISNKESINLLMVKNGLARVNYISLNDKNIFYTKNKKFYYQLLKAEEYAKTNKMGFWILKNDINKVFKNKSIKK